MRLQSKVLLLITPAIVLPLLVIGWFAYIAVPTRLLYNFRIS